MPLSAKDSAGPAPVPEETLLELAKPVFNHRTPQFRQIMKEVVEDLQYAFCTKNQRDTLLEILARSKQPEDHPARNRVKVRKDLAETKSRGFAVFHRPRRVSEETTFSVPIIADGRLLAALTVRFSSSAIPQAAAIERFVPKLRKVADRIGQEFVQQQKAAGVSDDPPTVS